MAALPKINDEYSKWVILLKIHNIFTFEYIIFNLYILAKLTYFNKYYKIFHKMESKQMNLRFKFWSNG